MSLNVREDDDVLHDPRVESGNGHFFTLRAASNLGCLVLLVVGILMLLWVHYLQCGHCLSLTGRTYWYCSQRRWELFAAVHFVPLIFCNFSGYPILSHFLAKNKLSNQGGFNLGGINATGQVPSFSNFGLIDPATPKEAYTQSGYLDPSSEYVLVFSDEFETDGRTFYPGDDPFWEAVDLHYWGTVSSIFWDAAA